MSIRSFQLHGSGKGRGEPARDLSREVHGFNARVVDSENSHAYPLPEAPRRGRKARRPIVRRTGVLVRISVVASSKEIRTMTESLNPADEAPGTEPLSNVLTETLSSRLRQGYGAAGGERAG